MLSKKKKWEQMPIGGMITEQKSALKNKTGSWRSFRPILDKDKCIHCMQCVFYCPENCIRVSSDGKKRGDTDLDYCKGCGICANVCPVNAITMVEEGKETKSEASNSSAAPKK
jgi:pyruvate ferredoxin oxidoreductase delta subunit